MNFFKVAAVVKILLQIFPFFMHQYLKSILYISWKLFLEKIGFYQAVFSYIIWFFIRKLNRILGS
jgi:hypothetical protein